MTKRQRRTSMVLGVAGITVLVGNAVLAGSHLDFFWFRLLGFALLVTGLTLSSMWRSRPPS